MQLSYSIAAYQGNPNCSSIAPPSLFGAKSYVRSDSFTIGFDVRSLFTCLAINAGIVDTNALQVTATSTLLYHNQTYPVSRIPVGLS